MLKSGYKYHDFQFSMLQKIVIHMNILTLQGIDFETDSQNRWEDNKL